MDMIDRYIYDKINRNFSIFFGIVIEFRSFDLQAKISLQRLHEIQTYQKKTKEILENQIMKVQEKILTRIKILEIKKHLQTIKYIEKANHTIQNLFEQTNYVKIREILMIMKNGIGDGYQPIKVLKSSMKKMYNLRDRFLKNMTELIKRDLQLLLEPIMEKFKDYLINYIPEVEIFTC